MKTKASLGSVTAIAGLLILIADSETARSGMVSGIENCLHTLIPALFPFMLLCALITGNDAIRPGALLRTLGRFCHIPTGCEHLLVIGFLGGYPTGAKSVSTLYSQGVITREDARRLVVFCNNPGPAFIFGILGGIFRDLRTVILLWIIQILSALLMGHFLPRPESGNPKPARISPLSLTDALGSSIHGMATICGWVIAFRVVLEYLDKWILRYLPTYLQVLVAGSLELTNGCLGLPGLEAELPRFILASVMLSFGGLCICLQTESLCEKEIFAGYIRGKFIQSIISLLLCVTCCFAANFIPVPLIIGFLASLPFIHTLLRKYAEKRKIEVAF